MEDLEKEFCNYESKKCLRNILVPIGAAICLAMILIETDSKRDIIILSILIGMQIGLTIDGIIEVLKK